MVEQIWTNILVQGAATKSIDISFGKPYDATSDVGSVMPFNVAIENIYIWQSKPGKRIPK